jgi:hypothetical protein
MLSGGGGLQILSEQMAICKWQLAQLKPITGIAEV